MLCILFVCLVQVFAYNVVASLGCAVCFRLLVCWAAARDLHCKCIYLYCTCSFCAKLKSFNRPKIIFFSRKIFMLYSSLSLCTCTVGQGTVWWSGSCISLAVYMYMYMYGLALAEAQSVTHVLYLYCVCTCGYGVGHCIALTTCTCTYTYSVG